MYYVPQQNLSAHDTQDFDHSRHSRRAVAVASLFLDPSATGTGADLILAPGAPATVDRFGSLVGYGYTLPLLAVLKHTINFTLTYPSSNANTNKNKNNILYWFKQKFIWDKIKIQ